MTLVIRVQVHDEFLFSGGIACRVVLADISAQGHIVRAVQKLVSDGQGRWQWHHITDEERMGNPPEEPSVMIFPEGVGEALQEALSRHFHGGSAPDRLARADFEHERSRRDTAEDRLDVALVQAMGLIKNPHLTSPSGPTLLTPRHQELMFHAMPACLGHMPYDYDAAHCPNVR